jgi:PAS domain S-box-containing protein
MKDKPIILVVDDQPQNIELIEAYLLPQGYDIVTATNGEKALEKLSGNDIDLMLLDVMMPGMDGFEVIRRVRQDTTHRLLPIILLSSLRGTEDRVKGIEAGCDDFISKPFNKTELLARVRSLLKVKAYSDLMNNYREELESEVTRRTEELKHAFENLQREITEHKRAEDALRESEERFKAIFDSASDGILLFDTETMRFCIGNKKIHQMLGYTENELKNLGVMDLHSEADLPHVMEQFKKMARGEIEIAIDIPVKRKDGSIFHADINSYHISWADSKCLAGIFRDITERKQAEEVLRAANAYNRSLIEASLDPLVTIGENGKITDVNAATEKVTGCLREELIGTDFSDYFTEPEKVRAEYKQVFTEGFVLDYPLILRHRDGRLTDVLYNASVYRDESGKVIGVFAAARDITERKKSEDSILASLRLAQFAQTHSLDELLQAALDEAEKMTGSQVGFLHFLEPDQKTLSLQMWSTRTLQEMCRAEGKGRHYDMDQAGVWVDCVRERRSVIHNDYSALPHKKGMPPSHAEVIRELVVPVFRGDRIVAILGVGNKRSDYNESDIRTVSFFADLAWDIAERKQAEMALHESEDKYHSIVENAMEGIFQTTPEGRYISANPALARMIGYNTPEELIETVTDIPKQGYVNPEDRVRYLEILKERGTFQGFETQHYRKDGSIIWVSFNARAVRDPAGKVLYYEGTMEDVTVRKTADENLKRHAEKLRQSLMGTIKALSMTIEARDPYTSGHQMKVSRLAHAIAQDMALSNDIIDNIRVAGSIHDIGKISVPSEILSKPCKLTDMEFRLIKLHSQTGYDILKDAELPCPIAEIVLQHHERLDGSGYPQGLKNHKILLEARIIAVADVVEAMASHRPYRPALGIDAALEEIEKNQETLYDADVVDVCLRLFREKGYQFEKV